MASKITPENSQCCSIEETCCGARGIDLDKPLVVLGNPESTVRLLTNHIETLGYEGALIAIGHTDCLGNSEVICILNKVTGRAIAVYTGVECPLQIGNVPEPVESVNYVNVYVNKPGTDDVCEAFPTRDEADSSNLFYSRDCCVKLRMTRTNGIWSATATVEAQ